MQKSLKTFENNHVQYLLIKNNIIKKKELKLLILANLKKQQINQFHYKKEE